VNRWHIRFEWKLPDLWIGAFWKTTMAQLPDGPKPIATDVWICFLPCVPLHITYWHRLAIPHDVATVRGKAESK